MDIVDIEYYDECGETRPGIKGKLTRRILTNKDLPRTMGELYESTKYNRNGEPIATALCFVPIKGG